MKTLHFAMLVIAAAFTTPRSQSLGASDPTPALAPLRLIGTNAVHFINPSPPYRLDGRCLYRRETLAIVERSHTKIIANPSMMRYLNNTDLAAVLLNKEITMLQYYSMPVRRRLAYNVEHFTTEIVVTNIPPHVTVGSEVSLPGIVKSIQNTDRTYFDCGVDYPYDPQEISQYYQVSGSRIVLRTRISKSEKDRLSSESQAAALRFQQSKTNLIQSSAAQH